MFNVQNTAFVTNNIFLDSSIATHSKELTSINKKKQTKQNKTNKQTNKQKNYFKPDNMVEQGYMILWPCADFDPGTFCIISEHSTTLPRTVYLI